MSIELIDGSYRPPLPGEVVQLYGLPVSYSELVPPGEVMVINPGGLIGRRLVASPFDSAGYPTNWFRVAGYTRHTLGTHELARDRRRHS